MTVDQLWHDTLGQARRVGVERCLVGFVEDVLKCRRYIW